MSDQQPQSEPEQVQLPQQLELATIAAAITEVNKAAGALVEQKKFRAAKIALCRALTVDPHSPTLWQNLSCVMWNLRAYEDALGAAKTSLALNKEGGKALCQGLLAAGNAFASLQDYDTALKCFDEAIQFDPDFLDAKWNRSLLLLLLGDYTSGFKDYDLFVDWHKRGEGEKKEKKDSERYGSPAWQGESLAGKAIHVLHDHGYGDTILYSRFLMWAAIGQARKVYFSTTPSLASLMWDYQELFPNLEMVHPGAPLPKVDYHAYLGALPKLFGLTSDNLPSDPGFILSRAEIADLSRIDIIEPKVQPSLKVGICWSGRTDFGRNDERAIPLRLISSLAENPHIWLYSLQAGPVAAELYELGLQDFIMDLNPQMTEKGWLGTATAILQMDVVVTCCTSIAHLAGVLGIPCWVLLHTEPYWIWGTQGETSPWYPSVRLFRQLRERRSDWTCVLEEVRSELSRLVSEKMTLNTENTLEGLVL